MPSLEFFGPSSRDAASRWVSSMRLVNFYRETVGGNPVLKAVPGMTAWGTTPGSVFCRAMAVIDGQLFAVFDRTLYSVSSAGVATSLASMAEADFVSLAGNNGTVTLSAGGRYQVWDIDAATFSEPTGGAFSSVGDVTFFGQRAVMSERNGRRVQWSALADPTDLDSLSFATAEATDDNILRLMPIGGSLWVFKERSRELWYQTATGVAPIPGSARGRGLKSANLLVAMPDGAFFVGDDGKCYIASGQDAQPISVVAVESAIASETPVAMFYYQEAGHEFCCLAFQSRPAWCFDLSTGEWHERSEGFEGAWKARAAVKAYGSWRIGVDASAIYTLGGVEDNGAPMIRRAVSTTLDIGPMFRVPLVSIRATVGEFAYSDSFDPREPVLAMDTPPGDEVLAMTTPAGTGVLRLDDVLPGYRYPQIELRASLDHGQTWRPPRMMSLGPKGNHQRYLSARAMGQFRRLTIEVRASDPWEIDIGATVDVEIA